MSEHDHVRAALGDLVGRPPLVLGRRGAVMNQIARIERRRKVAVQASLSAFLVASAVVGANQVINAAPAGSDRLVQEPKPTEPPHTESTKPKPTHTESPKPKPTYTESPKPKPTYAEAPKPEPTKVVEPPAGLAVGLWPYGSTPFLAGEPMKWALKVRDGAGRLQRIELWFGDEQHLVYEPDSVCGEGVSLLKLVSHTYAAAGTYGAKVSITTGGCGAATETKTAASVVTVKPKTVESTNGPAAPTVSAEQVAGELAKVALFGSDADGWVKKFIVHWGDGTESYVGPKSLDACTNAEGTSHPAASSWDPYATHAYSAPGTYSVTVTVYSTSCTGSAMQSASVTISVTVA